MNIIKSILSKNKNFESILSNNQFKVESVYEDKSEVFASNISSFTLTHESILTKFKEFQERRTYNLSKIENNLSKVFIASLFASFPFISKVEESNSVTLAFKEFKTDDLSSEQPSKVIAFLDEIIKGTYTPSTLSKDLHQDNNLYRVKTRARQDLRMLGFLDDSHQEVDNLFQQYKEAADKKLFLRNLLLKNEYFNDTLQVLQLLKVENPREKRKILLEIAMLIVRNSKGTNLMVASVGTDRIRYLVNWLEYTNLVDSNLSPIDYNPNVKEPTTVQTNLYSLFKKIMNEYLTSRQQPFGGHPLGSVVRREVRGEIEKLPFINENYSVGGSVGQGNWAAIPWVAIMNEKVTSSTQRGYYIVYLFSEEMGRLYLTLAQGVAETTPSKMAEVKQEIRELIEMDPRVKKDDEIHLGSSKKARAYAESTAAYIEYYANDLPPEEVLVEDLHNMVRYYEEYISLSDGSPTIYGEDIQNSDQVHEHASLSIPEAVDHIHTYISSKGFYYEKEEVINLYLSLKTKPFVILSGISGTGKTMMVRWFAESVGATEKNGRFALIPVRPDWSDGSDLLGYIDIKGEFKEGPLTKVLKQAMSDPPNPYFVLLDEMNLARVEHYFSDLLSVMESKQWRDGMQVTSNVLPVEVAGTEVYLPSNVYLIGTVNMDETTHPFSKKVLDRANTLEFNRVQLDHLAFLKDQQEKSAMVLHNDKFASEYLQLKDLYVKEPELVEEVTSILVRINSILQFNGSHIGYRIRDEVCFYVAYSQSHKLLSLDEAIDNSLLQKILPRLAGSDTRIERVLKNLFTVFTNKEVSDTQDVTISDIQDAKYPKSAEKVLDMLRRLEDDGFTSFWISS
ncbi:DUF3578 domain-containing protein [Alkalihalophilus lindianensis]|uniref:DUF3578 domain-containing protein n=1 Tax=Alkalihalophilus lindianensis TaxID=1630542 RepID=A0ABU3XGG5_9BACI|nr:DUF3578 domain-containing protein [Alkalihalophilus lindianensis]MDV2686489.1 DUF3578 domain-containing protein [Alkalihalophilus lindianensis]